jgi:hypothetical protein
MNLSHIIKIRDHRRLDILTGGSHDWWESNKANGSKISIRPTTYRRESTWLSEKNSAGRLFKQRDVYTSASEILIYLVWIGTWAPRAFQVTKGVTLVESSCNRIVQSSYLRTSKLEGGATGHLLSSAGGDNRWPGSDFPSLLISVHKGKFECKYSKC